MLSASEVSISRKIMEKTCNCPEKVAYGIRIFNPPRSVISNNILNYYKNALYLAKKSDFLPVDLI